MDPQFCMGSDMLEILVATFLDLLIGPAFGLAWEFPDVLLTGDTVLTTGAEIYFLEGIALVEVNLIKGHLFPSIVNFLPVGIHLYPTLEKTFPMDFQTFLYLLLANLSCTNLLFTEAAISSI